ncbi:MAG: glycerol-3-phosphate 1-O-acyltransferase PlsY [Betaproteobacteria bacterium]|nr:glycerol-3-phosphate 1-O-acyltransferase PlsY [Betaproteobacteria bacterium]
MDAFQSYFPILAALAAYLMGSLSFAVIVSRAMGLKDPRSYGSKNPGATNVLRSGSKPAAVVTLLLDGAKGWLPVMLVASYGRDWGMGDGTLAMVGLAAFAGHLFPLYFGFQGGKGVATALGVLFGVHWALGLGACASWLIVAYFFRYSSLASLVTALFAPVYYAFGDGLAWYSEKSVLLGISVISLLLVWRHAPNISRLVRGTETRIGAGRS